MAENHPTITPYIIGRFNRKFEIAGNCWEWSGRLNEHGYGLMTIGHSKTFLAHRISYQIHAGEISAGALVLHSCDNRRCVNPSHLRLGTQAENVTDMMTRGRHVAIPQHGESNPSAKLTAQAVAEIRRQYSAGEGSQREIAKRFGVCQQLVGGIVSGKRWGQVQ